MVDSKYGRKYGGNTSELLSIISKLKDYLDRDKTK